MQRSIVNIIFSDDHELFREGIKQILSQLAPEFKLAETKNFSETLGYLEQNESFDLALIDLKMPDMDSWVGLNKLIQKAPFTPIVVLSGCEDPADMKRCIDAGVMGYIPKSVSPIILIEAIRLVLSGGIYIPPDMLDFFKLGGKPSQEIDLTPRQIEVLKALVKGCSNKQIASNLKISESTVKIHISAIFKTLNVTNRTQLAMVAKELRL